MKQLLLTLAVAILIATFAVEMSAQDAKPEEPSALTQIERLETQNLILQVREVSARISLAAAQHKELVALQRSIALQLGAKGRALIEVRGLSADNFFFDVQTLTIKARVPQIAAEPIQEAEVDLPEEKEATATGEVWTPE